MEGAVRGRGASIVLAGICLCSWTPAPVAAQEAVAEGAGAKRSLAAAPVAEAPVLDGDVLADPAWARAAPSTGFWQTTPDEGQPATERTEVRIGLHRRRRSTSASSATTASPAGIIVADSRRDSSLDETDSFQVALRHLPRPAEAASSSAPTRRASSTTARSPSEGEGGFGVRLARFNLNWDGAWEVEARITEIGWSAEFAIPFRTLRYAARRRAGLGHQLPAQHPAPQRDRLLGAAAAAVQPLPAVAGRARCVGVEPPEQRNLQADALRAGGRRTGRGAEDQPRPRTDQRGRRRPQVRRHARA